MSLLLLFFSASLLFRCNSIEVNGISAIRFAQNTGVFPQGRDGVLEVKYEGSWTSICNFGFDYVAASTACYMLGFPPYGFTIYMSNQYGNISARLSNFNCTGRVKLGPNPPEPSSVHLGNCEFSTDVPRECSQGSRNVAIACLEPTALDNFDDIPPLTFAPVLCPANSSEVRLTHGDEKSGLLEVKNPTSEEWGTVCADGFGINEAKAVCRMLCSSSDDLAYAHPVVNLFGNMSEVVQNMPIHLARLSCPVGAQSLNDCSLGDGWGNAQGCSHALDVGVICGPPDEVLRPPRMPIETSLKCDHEIARVYFNKDELGEVDSSTVYLNRTNLPSGCTFKFSELDKYGNESSLIEVLFPMDKCGATYEGSNSTVLALNLPLIVNTSKAPYHEGYESDGVSTEKIFVLPITCLIPRQSSVDSPIHAAATSRLEKLVSLRDTPNVQISYFADRLFRRRISERVNIIPNRRVYVRVSIERPEQYSKLVLTNCVLSNNRSMEMSIPLISKGCLVSKEIQLLPISRSAVGFSFETAYFRKASQTIRGGNMLEMFVSCQTRLCHIHETEPECIQSYCH
nr:Speract scavenger receptor [Hymenolepis microstoma]